MRSNKGTVTRDHRPQEPSSDVRPRPGSRVTTRDELSHVAMRLFLEHGYEQTTIDDIAAAAGIGRRTFFRYFSSKPEVVWGDFDELLAGFRDAFARSSDDVPAMEAVLDVMLEFSRFPEPEVAYHRGRMWLLLNVPSLRAYSLLKYADWRTEIARFVAARRGEEPDDLAPQAISWVCLGLSISSYERWIADESSDLLELLSSAFASAEAVFGTRDTTTFS